MVERRQVEQPSANEGRGSPFIMNGFPDTYNQSDLRGGSCLQPHQRSRSFSEEEHRRGVNPKSRLKGIGKGLSQSEDEA